MTAPSPKDDSQQDGPQLGAPLGRRAATLARAPAERRDALSGRERALWFGLITPVCLVALTLSTLFVLRSQLLAGPYVRQMVEREAAQRGVDVYIKRMRPRGLFDVRFEQVRVRTRRGAYVLDTQIATMDVSPDLWASLTQRRPVPRRIAIDGAQILLERDGFEASSPQPSSPAPPDAREESWGGAIEIVGSHVTIALKTGAFVTTKPLALQRINALLPLDGVPLPTSMSAYGEFPDGVPFALSTTSRGEGLPGRLIELKPQGTTRLDRWFHGQLPLRLSASGLTLCSGCERDRVALGAVALELPNFGKGLSVLAPSAELVFSEDRGELELHGVAIQGMQTDLDLSLEELKLDFEPSSGLQRGRLQVRDEAGGGQVALSWTWRHEDRVLTAELDAERFALRPTLALLDAAPLLKRGDLNGTAKLAVDWRSALIEAQTDLTFTDISALIPWLSKDTIDAPLLVLESDLLLDLRGRALSLDHAEVTFEGVKPIRVRAHVIDAEQGWRFEIAALGRDLHAPALLEALPKQVTRPVRGAELSGHFGFDLNASGHSAYPESLALSIEVDGDVQVRRDGPMADILSLKTPGYPSASAQGALNIPISPVEWVDFEQLPAHLPRTLLAAEDTAFYRHGGFDFNGLARAMIHNIKVRRMERGGSTLTQQLVKNLFLSGDRTALRKIQEAYLTWRVEHELSKTRLLELYLNLTHWGEGIYGLSAASAHYFEREPQLLTVEQMALLGAILPNPERFGAQLKRGQIASSRVEKIEHVLANLRFLGDLSMEDYLFLMARARRGHIGELTLEMCRDDETVEESVPACTP